MKVLANSIPKGGTHLLMRLINALGIAEAQPRFWIGAGLIRGGWRRGPGWLNKLLRGRGTTVTIGSEVPVQISRRWLGRRIDKITDATVFGAHCLYSPELSALLAGHDVRVACIIRDPRAIAVSHLHYIKRNPGHFFHDAYMALAADDERIELVIRGGQAGKLAVRPLKERYEAFVGWRQDANAVTVRFEDLVGPKGGGTQAGQKKAITEVAQHLHMSLDDRQIETITDQLFGSSATFRSGQIDAWRDELNPPQLAMLQNEIGHLLPELGYQ